MAPGPTPEGGVESGARTRAASSPGAGAHPADGGLGAAAVALALECGADLAGVVDVADLRGSPSHRLYPRLESYSGVGSKEVEGRAPGQVDWPRDAVSLIVVALRHPEGEPELDWWRDGFSGGTEGNRRLMDVNRRLAERLGREWGVTATPLAYHIEHGGVFLKDAAAMAGLGVVGKNNLLLTPGSGPRVRLRALTIDRWAEPTGPSLFDPCTGCAMPCREACPRSAMSRVVRTPEEWGQDELPGRDGAYDRLRCDVQMQEDAAGRGPAPDPLTGGPSTAVRYCRRCEWACWVGKGAPSTG